MLFRAGVKVKARKARYYERNVWPCDYGGVQESADLTLIEVGARVGGVPFER
jgi:hypothetical protein